MTNDITIELVREKATPILKEYGVRKAGIFGSLVKDGGDSESDIDILYETPEGMDLIDYIDLKTKLESVFGRHVDLVDYSKIKSIIREEILSSEVVMYS